MFEGYKVYKQWHKKQGRYYAILYHLITKHRTSMSWAKYTMCLHLNRELDPDTETVDHINNDKSDDRLENLQLLTRPENVKKSAKGRTFVTLVCPQCQIEFTRERKATHLTKGSKQTFCCRRCSGLYYAKQERLKRPAQHGTKTDYNRGCRCELCRAANIEHCKKFRLLKQSRLALSQ